MAAGLTFDDAVKQAQVSLRRAANWRCRGGLIEADDLIQETIIRAWKAWPEFDGNMGLFFHIMHQQASMMWRRATAQKRSGGEMIPLEEWDDDLAVSGGQESVVELQRVEAAMAAMKPRDREILIARTMGDEQQDIAERIGVTHQRVQQIEKRAREFMEKLK